MSEVVSMDVAPTVLDNLTGVDLALAKLAHKVASETPDTPPLAPASDKRPDAPISQSFATTLGPPDLSTHIPPEQGSRGKRSILARGAIAICLGASALWAWQSYGAPVRDMIATGALPFGWILTQMPSPAHEQAAAPPAVEASAPPPPQGASQAASQAAAMTRPATTAANAPVATAADEQIKAMARDLAALRQTVEQLAAGQTQLTREMAKLQADKPQAVKPQADKPTAENLAKRKPRHVATPGTGSDAFDPTQNPTAPGVPRPLGSVVLRR
jgi:chemotaxis protein histidine kinase CheA